MNNPISKLDIFAPETILKTEDNSNESETPITENDLMSLESLRESPVQWPERFPGLDDFITMCDTPIHTSKVESSCDMTSENIAKMNEFAQMTPDQLIEKITLMHDEIYKLGLREAKEVTRGKLLGIFDRAPFKRTP